LTLRALGALRSHASALQQSNTASPHVLLIDFCSAATEESHDESELASVPLISPSVSLIGNILSASLFVIRASIFRPHGITLLSELRLQSMSLCHRSPAKQNAFYSGLQFASSNSHFAVIVVISVSCYSTRRFLARCALWCIAAHCAHLHHGSNNAVVNLVLCRFH
jgi:hypothetical protein